MHEQCSTESGIDRRRFVTQSLAHVATVAALGATMASAQDPPAEQQPLLPTIDLGPHKVTRLVAGYNPIGGYSHTTLDMSIHMREFFTAERTAQFLLDCERAGINTWQYDRTDKTVEALRIARERGSGIQVICLHADRPDTPLSAVMEQNPIAIVHHGGVTDGLFRGGKAGKVRDFVKAVKDQGVLAGISAHCPDHIKQAADEGWEVDLFMCCFYHLTRPREEMVRDIGKVPVGEPFFESDRDEMTAAMRAVGKPCLGFKILAAGQSCWSPNSTEAAFEWAFAHIKPTDGVIVGMYPCHSDEVGEDAGYARKHGQPA
jgi:hypothetical protein